MTDAHAVRYRITLFGTFEVLGKRDVATTAAWRSQQNRTILKVLLLNRGHTVTSDMLLDILWPDEAPTVTRRRLYVRMSQLRRMLDPDRPQVIIRSTDNGGYRIPLDAGLWIDVDAFEAAAARGRRAQERGSLDEAIRAYETARRLYRGDLLEEDRYADWTLSERERLLERYLTLLTELAEAYAQQGRYRRAIALYRRVLDRDPFREAVFVRLILVYTYAGEPSQALRMYERCRQILSEEMDIAPLPATQALAAQIRSGTLLTADKPPQYPPPAYVGRLFEIPYSLGHTPFVGREREYAWLIARWREARPGLILVEGEAGVGKTRLVEEALGFAATQSARVMRAFPLPEGTAAPYAPLVEALRPLWRTAPPLKEPSSSHSVLDSLFEAQSPSSPQAAGHQGTRDNAQRRPQSYIVNTATNWLKEQCPPETILYIDDAPNLDTASLALALGLAQAITVVVTARSEALSPSHPLREEFHVLAHSSQADLLAVNRIAEDAVTALIRQLAQRDLPRLTGQLASRTSGNPLFLVAALQSLFETGALHVDSSGAWAYDGGDVMIPPSVHELIEQRLQNLVREARQVFDVIALIDQDFDFALLQLITESEEIPLLNTLDDLIELGLVIEPRAQGRGEFAPAHGLYTEVARATLPGVRARRLHGRIGDALHTLYPDDVTYSPRLAYHYHRANRVTAAVPAAVRAGELALDQYSVQQAQAHFEDAARWTKAAAWTPPPPLLARLHAGWAEALRRGGEPEAALDHYTQALPHANDVLKLHLVYQMTALRTMNGADPHAFSRWAKELETEISNPLALSALRCVQTFWEALYGNPARARRCAAEGWSHLRHARGRDEVPQWLLDRATIILARTHALWGEWRLAQRYATQALDGNRARDDAYGAANAHVTLAQATYGLGHSDEAGTHAQRALSEAEAAGDLRLQGKAIHVQALVCLRGASPENVELLVERLLDIAEQTGDLEAYARGQLLRAQLLQRAGALDAARGLLQMLLARARGVGIPSYMVTMLRQLAEVQFAAGDIADAQATIHQGLILAHQCRMQHEVTRLTALTSKIGQREYPPSSR